MENVDQKNHMRQTHTRHRHENEIEYSTPNMRILCKSWQKCSSLGIILMNGDHVSHFWTDIAE